MKKITYLALALGMTACTQVDDPWKQADAIVANMKQVQFPELTVSITDFGAVANCPEQLAHEAINAAILSVNEQGGGTVVIPDSTYYTGPITLKSNVRLHLSDNALLKFSTDINDYFPAVITRWEGLDCYNTHPLIYAYQETNIALTGKGTLDAQGAKENWWGRMPIERQWKKENPEDPNSREITPSRIQLLYWGEGGVPIEERRFTPENALRPQFVNFYSCNTVLIEDVTLLNSPFWVLHPLLCQDVTVRGVTVKNHGPNGDGCDPESCKNVLIENCVFDTGDDCIAIKSGRNEDGRKWNIPSENIVVRGCHMADGHGGVVIGSEISGGYRNLYVEDCTMDSPNLDRVIRIKTSNCRGGIIENIYVRNVKVGECKEAVLRINLNYEPKEDCRRAFNPIVRNVNLENVVCNKSKYGVWFCGLKEETNIYDISLKDCDFNGVTSGTNHLEALIGEIELDNLKLNGEVVTELTSEEIVEKVVEGYTF